MGLPSHLDVHINGPLTTLSVGFLNADSKFVADRVFPRVSVQKKSDSYFTYDRGDFLRDEMKVRGPGSESAGGGYRISTDSYDCDVYAYHQDVDDQTRANTDDPLRPDDDAVRYLVEKAKIKREVDWGSNFFTTSVWTGSTTGTDLAAGTDFTAWDNQSSTPIETINDEMAEIESNTAMLPNTLVLNRRGWYALKNHSDIIERIKHTSSAAVTEDLVARLLGLDRIFVGAAIRNSAQEGLTATTDYVFGNHALLCYSAPSAGLRTASAGYTFVWDGLEGSQSGQVVSSFRMPALKSDRLEIEASWDHKVVSAICGAFFQNVVS